MFKNKNIRYFLLIVLLPFSIYVWIRSGDSRLVREMKKMRVENAENLTSISIKKGESPLLIEKEGDVWILNDSLKTNEEGIQLMLLIAGRMEPKGMASRAQKDRLDSLYEEQGIQIVLQGSKIYRFDLVGDASIAYMRREGKRQWFVMEVPGLSIPLHKLIKADMGFWMDKTLLPWMPNNFQSFEFTIVANNKSYRIVRNSGRLDFSENDSVRAYSDAYMQAFLYRCSMLRLSNMIEKDSVTLDSLSAIERLTIQGQGGALSFESYDWYENGKINSDYVLLTRNNSEYWLIKALEWDAIRTGLVLLLRDKK